jgi:hypothetical protein
MTRDLTGNIVSDRDDKPATKHTLSRKAAQALRISQLEREGCTVVRGPGGLTVFRW